MFKTENKYSIVTAVLPNSTTNSVVESIVSEEGATALAWKARGTLLHDHWWSRLMPPIGPVKNVLQMLVPDTDVARIEAAVIENGKLHQQATGAVFSTPCENAYLGSEFHTWPIRTEKTANTRSHDLTENLSIIYCIVGQALSDRVARAAVNAGAHGPVIYFGEGRGLRDRMGWLRITKEHVQEVLMVIADEAQVEEVFDAMAKVGEFHKPGRGFMYRISIDRGMFNLPSRFSHHRYPANMQQIINAIDHLSGHNHWRDQGVFDMGSEGKGVGLECFEENSAMLKDRVCLTAVVNREQMQSLIDMMLDSGAPGLNMTYARFIAAEESCQVARARINDEYAVIRCIVDRDSAEHICAVVDDSAENQGIRDLSILVNPVPRIATYVPGKKDYRQAKKLATV